MVKVLGIMGLFASKSTFALFYKNEKSIQPKTRGFSKHCSLFLLKTCQEAKTAFLLGCYSILSEQITDNGFEQTPPYNLYCFIRRSAALYPTPL